MFLFKTEVKAANNPQMGLGLFAKEYIPRGAVVWRFFPGIDIMVPVDVVEGLSIVQKEYFEKYAWVKNGYYYSSCDLSNFINHSDTPNLKFDGDIVYALEDIFPEEELFENYKEFDDYFDEYKDDYL